MKKVLSVRVEKSLYTRVNKYEIGNSDLVSKALNQFFRSKEPSTKFFDNNSDYVDLLKQTLNEKNQYIGFLQKEVENLTVMSMARVPLLARIKMKLLKEKSE